MYIRECIPCVFLCPHVLILLSYLGFSDFGSLLPAITKNHIGSGATLSGTSEKKPEFMIRRPCTGR